MSLSWILLEKTEFSILPVSESTVSLIFPPSYKFSLVNKIV